jgi:hypothetical protein
MKREREWNACTSRKEKEKRRKMTLDYPKMVSDEMNAFLFGNNRRLKIVRRIPFQGKISSWTLLEPGFCHRPLKKDGFARSHYKYDVICYKTLQPL